MSTRQRDAAATRAAILGAARRRFLREGYAATTTRLVAADVGVDAALVNRYFGSKQQLWDLATAVDLDLPDLALAEAHEAGGLLVRHFLRRWEGEQGEPLRLLLAAAAHDTRAAQRVRDVFAVQVDPVVRAVAVDRPTDRAELVATTLLGLATCRYLVELPGVPERSADSVVALYGPLLQRHLTGTLHPPTR